MGKPIIGKGEDGVQKLHKKLTYTDKYDIISIKMRGEKNETT